METKKISENLSELTDNAKSYIQFRLNILKLDLTERLARLISSLLMSVIYFVVFICILVFLSITFILLFRDFIGPAWLAALIVTVFYVLVAVGIFLFRYRLFINPVISVLSKIILEDDAEEKK